jgi:hypothetical protein
MKDRHLREALKQKLSAQYSDDPNTRILEELAIRHGAARIDVAVVNGIIHGYELKSDYDTLKRLPTQAKIYNSVFDRITLIVGERHLNDAINIIPEWWGIKLAEMRSRDGVCFTQIRGTQSNPSQEILAISKLLWREEALTLLEEVGGAQGLRRKPRAMVYARLVEVADLALIQDRVRHQLKTRKNWRSGEQRMSDDD